MIFLLALSISSSLYLHAQPEMMKSQNAAVFEYNTDEKEMYTPDIKLVVYLTTKFFKSILLNP